MDQQLRFKRNKDQRNLIKNQVKFLINLIINLHLQSISTALLQFSPVMTYDRYDNISCKKNNWNLFRNSVKMAATSLLDTIVHNLEKKIT